MRLLRRRRRAKKDANHNAVQEALDERHRPYLDTSDVGGGFPDLVALHVNGHVVLLEVKNPAGSPSHQALTPAEAAVARLFPVAVVFTVAEALAAVGLSR